MSHKVMYALSSLILIAIVALAQGSIAHAAQDPSKAQLQTVQPLSKQEPEDAHVKGTVTAVNTGANTVTITPAGGSAVTLKVTNGTNIEINDKAGTIADITTGLNVKAEYDNSTLVAQEIHTVGNGNGGGNGGGGQHGKHNAKINGAVSAVDMSANTVTITPNGGSAVTLTINGRTQIQVKNSHGTLADLAVGMTVRAQYNSNTMVAKQIQARGGNGVGEPEDKHIVGTVSAVDSGASTVTIQPASGNAVTLNVTSGTKIEVNDVHGTIADITVGLAVRAEYDSATLNASEIEGTGGDGGEPEDKHITGTVSAVDTGASTVTILPASGNAVTVNVTSGTEIEVNDVHGTIADITVGLAVKAEYDSTTLNASEIEASGGDDGGHGGHHAGELEGTVSAVDTGANTVTITPSLGSAVTLQVNNATEIKVDGNHATLADVKVGQPVKAEFDATSLVASELKVGKNGGGHGKG